MTKRTFKINFEWVNFFQANFNWLVGQLLQFVYCFDIEFCFDQNVLVLYSFSFHNISHFLNIWMLCSAFVFCAKCSMMQCQAVRHSDAVTKNTCVFSEPTKLCYVLMQVKNEQCTLCISLIWSKSRTRSQSLDQEIETFIFQK